MTAFFNITYGTAVMPLDMPKILQVCNSYNTTALDIPFI